MQSDVHEQIRIHQTGDISVFELSGQFVGGDETDALREHILVYARAPRSSMVVDVADVPYVSSAFIGALLTAHASIARRGGVFMLSGANDAVSSVLTVTKIDTIIPNFRSLEEALASINTTK